MIRTVQANLRPPLRMNATPKATLSDIRAALERALAPTSIDIEDDSARHAGHAGARSGGHYRVAVVSAAFAGRTPLERHRMVYQALEPLMARGIHALNISARTPAGPDRPAT